MRLAPVAASSIKASPTVQRLIRDAGLEGEPLAASGPKGTVTAADVDVARAAKAEAGLTVTRKTKRKSRAESSILYKSSTP